MAPWGHSWWDPGEPCYLRADASRWRCGVRGYNRVVSRFYAPDEANALLPDVVTVVDRLRDQRGSLVTLRDRYRDRETVVLGRLVSDDPLDASDDTDDPELRTIRLRMRGIVDQMQADAAWLDERGIVLRDIATGLLDFPAVAGGRRVWLCWRSGEPEVGWWHRQDEGFTGRRPITDLGGEGGASPA
jgi:hypothetical protein